MILLDLKFRIGTLGLATGSLLTAFYNMNISTYIREYMWAFPAVSWTSAMFAAATLLYVSVVLRKLVRVKMKVHGEAMTTTWK
jgi:magnesium transporter